MRQCMFSNTAILRLTNHDPQTLQVKAFIDWEYAGYFLPRTGRWPRTLDQHAYAQRLSQLPNAIRDFIPLDYLACYDELNDDVREE